ncbi:MAG: pyridoxal phosphate enzyme (YggS family) [Granulosicoccus sp.]|jgi:pyridoxal phosphate enzyme (YggS family)
MTDNTHQLATVKMKIEHAAQQYHRASSDITLLAVSKTKPASAIADFYHAGQRAFGENYLQEAREKQQKLADLDIEWHFIGPIQSNKTKDIAEHFDWAHSVDRLKIATRLSQQRPSHLPPLNICIQVNIDEEPTKSGATLKELPALVEAISRLPQITLRGLMAIPAKKDDITQQRAAFAKLAQANRDLATITPLDTLSMGMSGDMEAAIAEGATIVRVGSALFGARAAIISR